MKWLVALLVVALSALAPEYLAPGALPDVTVWAAGAMAALVALLLGRNP